MTPHEYQEAQKARVLAMYSNAGEIIEKAAPKVEEAAASEATTVVADTSTAAE